MEYRYTLYVKYEGNDEPCLDADTTMDIAMAMTELQLAGYAPDDMYAIDTITGEIVMEGALIKS